MRQAGLDVSEARVLSDLAFGLPAPSEAACTAQTVGVGVMAYYGSNSSEDRGHADEIHAGDVEKIKRFVRWLADSGYQIRLFGGDNRFDDRVAEEILADLRAHRPGLEPMCAVAEPVTSMRGLMREMAPVGTVVATRFHNVLCALKLSKPTISIGYAPKHDLMMADMGLSEFCQSARSLDVDRFIQPVHRTGEAFSAVAEATGRAHEEKVQRLGQQFALLNTLLFPAVDQDPFAGRQTVSREIP